MTQLDLKKWVLAVLAFLVVLTCGLLLGGYASTYSQQEQQHTLQQQAVTYAGYIEQSAQNMTAITAELERQGQNAPKVNGMAVPQWVMASGQAFVQEHPEAIGVQFMSASGAVGAYSPYTAILQAPVLQGELKRLQSEAAGGEDTMRLVGPVTLPDGKVLLVARATSYAYNNTTQGFDYVGNLFTIWDGAKVLEKAKLGELADGKVEYQLHGNQNNLPLGGVIGESKAELTQMATAPVKVASGQWLLGVAPQDGWLQAGISTVVMGMSVVLGLLSGAAVLYFKK